MRKKEADLQLLAIGCSYQQNVTLISPLMDIRIISSNVFPTFISEGLHQLGHYFETKVTQLLVTEQRRKREKKIGGDEKKRKKNDLCADAHGLSSATNFRSGFDIHNANSPP